MTGASQQAGLERSNGCPQSRTGAVKPGREATCRQAWAAQVVYVSPVALLGSPVALSAPGPARPAASAAPLLGVLPRCLACWRSSRSSPPRRFHSFGVPRSGGEPGAGSARPPGANPPSAAPEPGRAVREGNGRAEGATRLEQVRADGSHRRPGADGERAREYAREGLGTNHVHPTPANMERENPSTNLRLAEGS